MNGSQRKADNFSHSCSRHLLNAQYVVNTALSARYEIAIQEVVNSGPVRCSRLDFFYLFTYLGIYLFILTSFKYSARLVTYSSWKAFHTCIVPLKCSSGTFYTRLLTFIGHCFTNLRKKQDSPSWVHVYGLENGVKREVIKWELSVLFGNTWYLNLQLNQ